ncbi:hypothetical protein LSCM1_06700 [Leishmania martiniquensis]|uniref:Uncharacterized protein n=1 Tax=Leishmania martiniquensis TaxID=1580590 RepID=A0A836KMM0_9TRYP|nr:hypothetical protein LSCM1_06700 [Leishmania martiniquensis]
MHYFIFSVLFLLVSVSIGVDALEVELAQSTLIGAEGQLSPHAVHFSDTSVCFRTVAAGGQDSNAIASTYCTFDAGSTFEAIKSGIDMCLRGILVDHELFCPKEQVQQGKDGAVEYAAVSFEARNSSIYKKSDETRLLFKGGKLTGALKQVSFNGNAIYVEKESAYVFVSTIVDEAGAKRVVVFRSEDGLVYRVISVIPDLEEAQEHYLISEGGRKLSVLSSFNGLYYTIVSSGYAGKHWSAMKMLNVSATPTSVMFSSGVQLQYACSNATSQRAKWYVTDAESRRSITKKPPQLPTVSNATSSSPFLAFSLKEPDSDKKRLLVLESELMAGAQRNVRASLYSVDDSAEEEEKGERIAKQKEELQKRELARLKAKLEKLEREKTQRREQRRQELARKAKFITLDEPNVRAAKAYLEQDGEMILVRRVSKDSIAFEKELFFSDL